MDNSNRREFLYGLGASLGAVALTDLLAQDGRADDSAGPLAAKPPMHPARAKAVIMLFMEGGPSHIDTFDPKPELTKLNVTESKRTAGLATGKRFYVGSPFESRKVGDSGIDMCDQFVHMANKEVADELCVYRGCQAESLNHPEALLHMNTGSRLGQDPSVGSWVGYGLGSENQNLPGFVVMTELALPQAGSTNWSNGFLPAYFQGTRLRSKNSPILDLKPPAFRTREHQRRALDELAKINAAHRERHPQHDVLAARVESYELAYRMQTAVPDIVNLNTETQQTRTMYGLDNPVTEAFGRQCLMARKLS